VNKAGNESLKTLMEGVSMTKSMLEKSFKEHGLAKYGVKGDAFDPNFHEALFQIPDATLAEGSVGQVLTTGYTLKGRVIRPAQVGTVKKP
jgi:molecular chaperone GrpE